MAQFFQVKVQFTDIDDKGKAKKQNIAYLVDAMSVTEAEARVTKYLVDNDESDFEVKAASESKIVEVILNEPVPNEIPE
jgi:hypothetical protein